MASLDISKSSLLSNLVPETAEEQELQNMFDEALNMSAPSKAVNPEKGFCVKLHQSDDAERKVFINICHTTEIPPPNEISEAELSEILQSENADTYRVPISLGSPHEEKDRKSNSCMAYDVILNSTFFDKMFRSELFRTFVILLAIQGVEDKYSVQLTREDFVILQNKKYMGTMPVHYIQERQPSKPCPLIDEIDSPMQQDSQESQDTLPRKKTYRMNRVQKPGRSSEHLVLEAKFPNIKSSQSLRLDVAKDRIVVRSDDDQTSLDICLPLEIVVNSARAQFDYKSMLLRVDVPILAQ